LLLRELKLFQIFFGKAPLKISKFFRKILFSLGSTQKPNTTGKILNFHTIANPIVSVVIPNYNHGKFLGDAIESVIKQTFTNIEVIIVDDLVQTGGTLYECAHTLLKKGAAKVSCFVTHGVFPNKCWQHFCKRSNGSKAVFETFWLTNSYPVANDLPKDDCFEILDLVPQILNDLDGF
jgi:cellulose synthase/poly-beta-1,6-N-acetylglucosamine synthase-like glycosyltransferase